MPLPLVAMRRHLGGAAARATQEQRRFDMNKVHPPPQPAWGPEPVPVRRQATGGNQFGARSGGKFS
ncbi:hypothetical protein, partial [Arthrobacter sp. JCM 19049]|uniref:hypothetical protein n=1 Tax=Arthrobacter sp. JCM 19049 TaxID=1460643 RepID=UPI002436C559